MSTHSFRPLTSYRKTTAACSVLAVGAAWLAWVGLAVVPGPPGVLVCMVASAALVGVATLACAGLVVLLRCRREAHGKTDLFLHLNRSRDGDAILARGPTHVGRWRRWLGRLLFGHDLLVGDAVQVKSWAEIRASLDERGCLEGLPFMPEMTSMCERRALVFRCMHRVFDYRKSRRMRHMDGAVLLVAAPCDGAHHGGCDAACAIIWKAAWLRRLPAEEGAAPQSGPCVPRVDASAEVAAFARPGPPYRCQLTQGHAASKPIRPLSPRLFLMPLVSGNVAPAAFVVGWLTRLFNELQEWRGGVDFPNFDKMSPKQAAADETAFSAGDVVVVRSASEIGATLDERSLYRGLYFEPDMSKHCGKRRRIQSEVEKIVDIVTGEMRVMKTPAYILQGVHFSGERQLFNSQCEPLFWRAVWLRRDPD